MTVARFHLGRDRASSLDPNVAVLTAMLHTELGC